MASTRHIALSHRPSNRDKYSIIIPAAGTGKRMKIYGPKSLTPYNNGTILSNQVKLIRECFNYYEIILVGGYQIDKLKSSVDDDIRVINNTNYESTNVLHSISLALNKIKNDRVVVIYGDLIFNKECLYLPFHNESGIVISEGMKDEEVGCIITNNILQNIFYRLPNKWAQIAYFTDNELLQLRQIAQNKPDWFGFEAINQIIINGGQFKTFCPKNAKSFDIDCTHDLKKINNENSSKSEFETNRAI